jgi:DNA-directed RNA polymerase specialized sigma24 family protein
MLTTDTIRKLYPENRFPAEYYPDLITVLSQSYSAQTKSIQEQGKNVRATFFNVCSLESLLNNDPGVLVMLYSHLIRIYVNKHCFHPEKRDDDYQEIVRRILQDKIERIRSNYNFDQHGERGFSSYFMAVVRNVFIDMVKSEKTHKERLVPDPDMDQRASKSGSVEWLDEVALHKEFNKLKFVFKLFGTKRARVVTLLKLKYRISLDKSDAIECLPKVSSEEQTVLTSDFRKVTDGELFDTIEPIFIKHDGKGNQSGSLRRWVNLKIHEILELLNKSHNSQVYDDGVLEILLHLYYKKN